MRYRLRTLLILMAVGPMVLAGAWFVLMDNFLAFVLIASGSLLLMLVGLRVQRLRTM